SPDGRRVWTLVSHAGRASEAPAAAGLLAAAADAVPVLFNAKDAESRYLFMNIHQARLFGVTPDAVLGRTAGDLLGLEFGSYSRGLDVEVLQTGRATQFFEESYPGADGVVRRWLTCKAPLGGEGGPVWGIATMAIDITERTRLEDGLRQAKEQAEAASRAKSGFLAAMSHELRTPLNAVIGFAEIIHQEVLGPVGALEYRDYAGHILRSGQHLLALINDILDYARIESGGLRLNMAPIDVRAVVRATLEVLGQTAAAGRVTLASDLAEQRIVILGDEQRLRQALLNVAGNAVKFTPAGGQVAVALRAAPDGGALITVSDSGIGIAEANMSQVFEPFWQADSGLDRLKAGAGIGLPLARHLVALHGGELHLDSRVGEGTKVTIRLRPGGA
ncbi:MAG: PAS domain-containing protein, partial [Rhodospirillales bacterium]|nr:PAS domain-containing protein [Rhodospirillales bacterium]